MIRMIPILSKVFRSSPSLLYLLSLYVSGGRGSILLFNLPTIKDSIFFTLSTLRILGITKWIVSKFRKWGKHYANRHLLLLEDIA